MPWRTIRKSVRPAVSKGTDFERLWSKCREDWSICDDYCVTNLPRHLLESGKLSELTKLITDLGYLERMTLKYGSQQGYWSAADIYRFLRQYLIKVPDTLIHSNEKLRNIISMPERFWGEDANDLEAGLSNYQERNLFSFSCCLDFDCFLNLGSFSDRSTCQCCGHPRIRYGLYDFSGADYYQYFFVWCEHCFWSSSQYSHSDDINYIPSRFDSERCAWVEDASWLQ